MNDIYEWAQKYRAISWQVIPLYNFTKIPSAVNWKEYQSRMATDEEFEEWFTDPKVTGLGLITGKLSGVVVLDEDMYKPGGIRVNVKTGMLAKTARDGRHHYFKYVEPIKSSGFREGINVEIKADGGFVVLPPSKVVIDGKEGTYEWLDKCHPEDLLTITEEQLLPYRPDRPEKVNLGALQGVTEGNRHNSLRSMALSLFFRLRKEEWGFAENIIEYESQKFDPPHPQTDVARIIKDAKEFVRTHSKDAVNKEIETEWVRPRTIAEVAEERIKDRELEKDAPKTGWPELDKLIKGFIPGHIYTLTGNTNVGKSSLACNFAEALSEQRKKTLYIALEPDVVLVDYLASVRHRKKFEDLVDDELRSGDEYIQVLMRKDVQTVDDLVRVLKNIKEHFDLIIIDHIGYFVHNEQNYIQNQANIIKELAFLAKEQKSAVMLIAHLRKPGVVRKKELVPTQDDISGSAAFKQDSTEVLIAHRPTVAGDEYALQLSTDGVLMVTKTKTGPNGWVPLIFEPRSAKIWSEQEALATDAGRLMLEQRSYDKYLDSMANSAAWEQKETDTDNDS